MKTNEVSSAKNVNKLLACLSLAVACFTTASSAAYASVAGHVQFINGNVQIVGSTGQARPAQKGDAINEGDTLTSAQSSSAQIKMQDGGFVAVRSETQLKFDQFKFSGKEDGEEKSFFSLFKGGFRAVTGLIGRVNKQNYRITTPTATIGIRGTDHETFVITPDSPLAQLAPTGAYNKVNVGETSMTTDKGTIVVQPNQMGFAGGMDQTPQLQPVNINLFTVVEAPAPENEPEKKEENANDGNQASGASEGASGETQTETAADGGSTGETAQETTTAAAPQEETVAPVRTASVVDATAPSTGGAPAATAPAAPTTTAPQVVAPPPAPTTIISTAPVAGGTTVNITTGTATTSTGQTIPVIQGLYATQAQAAAAAAAAAAANAAATVAGATDFALLVDTAPATNAIGSPATPGPATAATLAVNTAATSVAAAPLVAPPTLAATTNAGNVGTIASNAATQALAANTAATSAFHDSLATAANSVINTPTTGAAALVQSNNALVQAAAGPTTTVGSVSYYGAAQAAAQTAASTALGISTTPNTAQGDLAAANAALTAANTQNGIITTKQGVLSAAGVTGITTVQLAVTAANNAAAAAQAAAGLAASAQAAGDLTAAQNYLTMAQAELAKAQAAQAIVNAALAANIAVNSAATLAGTATSYANTVSTKLAEALTAQDNAAAALAVTNTAVVSPTPSAANTVQTQAAIVAANAPIATYNNPAVAGNFIAAAMFPIEVSPGSGTFNEGFAPSSPLQLNTAYVLDGSGNLVEARNLPFQVQANQNGNVLTPVITGASGADIKWSGGTAADTFKLSDNSIYAGRWMGATVTVTDNAIPANVYTYTPAASLWMVLLPPPANYVPTLVGTVTYNEAGNTTPVDAFGNLGVFGGATLVANFTSQVVNAAASLTMSAPSSMAGTFSVSGTAMPIDALGGFGIPNASYLITTCTAGACVAGAGGYSADMGGSFAGALAASIGMSYNIWPTTATSTDPATNSVQGLVAFTTGTAPTAPVNPAAGVYGRGFMIPNTIAGGYNTGRPYITPAAPNTSILLDGSGNLVTLLGTTYEEPGGPPGSPNPPTVAISNANITWSGGTATERYQSVSGDVVFGRWQGGSVTVTDLSVVTPLAPFTVDLAQTVGMVGPTSSLWAYASGPANGFVQSLTGTTTYTRTDWTTPFDSQGGMGVLNSASLSANFTNQLVSTVLNLTMNTGPLAGNTFNVADNMPINPLIAPDSNSFKSVALPSVTCSGGPCNPGAGGSFMAEMRGAFVGATVVDAILSYAVWNETPTAPSDIIYGYVAFNTATPPTVNPAGPLAAYSAINTSVAYTGAYGGAFNFTAAPGDISPVGNPTTFTERYGDGSGFRSDTLANATTTTLPTNMLTPGGTPITYGVWETVASVATTEQHRIEPGMSGTLPVYMYGAEGYLDSPVVLFNGTTGNTGPLAGAYTYTSVAATSFESDTWATGSVTTSTMSANFTTQTVSVALAGTMGANNWGLTSAPMSINFQNLTNGANAQFFDSAPTLTLNAAACPTCVGNINGTFVGQNYAGAIVQYGFYDNNGVQGMNAGGLVAFSNSTPVGTGGTPTGAFAVADAWQVGSQTTITTSGGVLTGWSSPGFGSTVAPAAGSVAQTAVGTGSGLINWGTWGAGSVAASTFSYTPGMGQFHWITAPEPTPVYLAEVLTTPNAVYNYVGGDVTSMDMIGGWARGTISGTTSITANFTTQTVAVALAATVNAHNWLASAANVPLQYLSNGNSLSGFNADSYRLPSDPGYLAVTVGGVAAYGNLAGQLVGAALDGAILKFNLDGQPAVGGYEYVQGTAALGVAVPNDPATPYRMVVTSISDPMAMAPAVMIGGSYNNAARVLIPAGNITQFDDASGGGSVQAIQYANAGTGAGFVDQGSLVIGGGTVSWGRWDAGTVINVQDRMTGIWQNGIVLTGGAHAVVGPLMTGPVALPTTGLYDYTLVGNTTPTTDTGALATLNTASTYLQANFTAQTVNVGVNVATVNATLGAQASGVPIQNRANFSTNSMMTGPGALVVTCSGTCGTTNHGMIGGGFGGPGGVAAAITYGFEKRGINAGTVSGVAVFQQGAVIPQ